MFDSSKLGLLNSLDLVSDSMDSPVIEDADDEGTSGTSDTSKNV